MSARSLSPQSVTLLTQQQLKTATTAPEKWRPVFWGSGHQGGDGGHGRRPALLHLGCITATPAILQLPNVRDY